MWLRVSLKEIATTIISVFSDFDKSFNIQCKLSVRYVVTKTVEIQTNISMHSLKPHS